MKSWKFLSLSPLSHLMGLSRPTLAWLALSPAVLLQAACGGGNDGTPPPTQVDAFALRAAVSAYYGAASSSQFGVTGSCNGTAARAVSAPAAATFEGASAYTRTMTTTQVFSDCTPASMASSVSLYTDADANPLGRISPGVDYGVDSASPTALPVSVKLGDTAVQAVQTLYTDSTKATLAGQRVLSYVIEADTSTSVIVNFIERVYDTKQVLSFTEQQRLRLDDLGALSMVSVDQQYTDANKTHLLLTAK